MEGFFRRYRNVLVLIAVVLAQMIALATQVNHSGYRSTDGHNVRRSRMLVSEAVAPFEKGFSRSGHGIRYLWNSYLNLRHTHQENQQLLEQLHQVRLHEASMSEDARQAQRLRVLLDFQRTYIGKTVAAQVIGSSGSDNSHVLTLDKGSKAGLKPDMAVITPDGIVGKLRNVYPDSSDLLLINDSSSGVGVILVNTRIRAVLHGNPAGQTLITNLLPDTRIKSGDQLITTGGDMVYPRGLPVGHVHSIGVDPDHQPYAKIVIETAANLQRLEEVLIITHLTTAPSDPTADTPEAENKSTADVLGERLPGLHDPNEKPQTGAAVDANGQPIPPADITPHPKPVVHPDRYSPGNTPPAQDLQPGAQHSGNTPSPEANQ